MMTTRCGCCLGTANFVEKGLDADKGKFDLYYCDTCRNFTRDFMLTEKETVEQALSDERTSANQQETVKKLEQLGLFEPKPRVFY